MAAGGAGGGLTRAEAVFAVAFELGEIDGDVIGVPEGSGSTENQPDS